MNGVFISLESVEEQRRIMFPATDFSPQEGAHTWATPLPLVATSELTPYPIDALPVLVRAAVIEVQSFTKAPIPLVASTALAALSLAIQAHADVKRSENLSGPSSLFLLTIADSGERKSTCDSFFKNAIAEYERREEESTKTMVISYKADIQAWEAKKSGITQKIAMLAKEGKSTVQHESDLRSLQTEEPKPPRIPKLILGDETPESLAWGLANRWPSSGVLSSEAGIVFGSHGMGKESAMRNMSRLNVFWDGGSFDVGRRSSDSYTVRDARLTMGLLVQEATLREFLDKAGALARGSGFLARFLVAWPETTIGTRNFTESTEWTHLNSFNQRLSTILNQPAPIDIDGRLSPAMLSMTPDAKAAWVKFHDDIESKLSCDGEFHCVKDVASKTADNAARLAALFHFFDYSTTGEIGVDTFKCASQIALWHLNESRRFLEKFSLPPEMANAEKLDAWLIDYCRKNHVAFVSTKEVQQYGPNALRSKAVLGNALQELEVLGRAKREEDGKRRIILVNPKLLGGRPDS